MDHKFRRGEVIKVLNSAPNSVAETYEVTIVDLLVSEDGNRNGYEIQVPSGKLFQVSEQKLIQLANVPNWKRVSQS